MDKLREIIEESVRNVLSEMDLAPTDRNDEPNLVIRQSVNAWKMLFLLMDNVKVKMKSDYEACGGKVSNQMVNDTIEYINMSINNILRNTIGGK